MSLHPPVVAPDTLLSEALQLFAQSGRRALPVIEGETLVGVLTEESILRAVAAVLSEVEQNEIKRRESESLE